MAETKGRLLFLEQYMLEHTDDDHLLTTDDLIRIYEENGFKVNHLLNSYRLRYALSF